MYVWMITRCQATSTLAASWSIISSRRPARGGQKKADTKWLGEPHQHPPFAHNKVYTAILKLESVQ
jgi:hypothetical protein